MVRPATWSLVPRAASIWNRLVLRALRVRVLLTVRSVGVPLERAGARAPPACTVTGPRTTPPPPKAALVATVSAPVPRLPLTSSVPALTVGPV